MASAIRCRTTTSTPPYRKRLSSISSAGARAMRALARRRSSVLHDILDTEISPELVPGDDGDHSAHGGFCRSLRAAGLQSLLHDALRLRTVENRFSCLCTHGRMRSGRVAVRDRRTTSAWLMILRSIKKWLGGLFASFLRDEPVQAHGYAERPKGEFRRFAVAAWRLARAERLFGKRMARRSRKNSMSARYRANLL